MSAGGATWDTAGTLSLGSGNSFDFADVTETGGERPYNHAWWVYTAPSDGVLTLDTFATTGSSPDIIDTVIQAYDQGSEPPDLDDYLFRNDDDDGSANGFLSKVSFTVFAGDVWHILVGSYDFDGDTITTYRLRASLGPVVITPWLVLTDNANNEGLENNLIVSREDYDLQALNVRSDYQIWQDWMDDVIRRLGAGPSRIGAWGAAEVPFSSHPPSEAVGCIWSHANWGEFGGQIWNGGGDISDTSPGVCRSLGATPRDQQGGLAFGYTLTDGDPPTGLFSRVAEAVATMSARAIYLRPVRDNTQQTGALFFPDPVADGVPEDAELEWEDDHVGVLGVDITGDSDGRSDESAFPVSIGIHDAIAPSYDPTAETYGHWTVGYPGDWNSEGTGYQQVGYVGGPTVDWTPLDIAITGADGWGSAADPGEDAPDTVAILGMDVMWGVDTPALAEVASNADLALRFRLQSPRYRWVYPDAEPTTVVRQWPRDDTRGVSSAPRLWPPSKSRRIAGGYPGGSGK